MITIDEIQLFGCSSYSFSKKENTCPTLWIEISLVCSWELHVSPYFHIFADGWQNISSSKEKNILFPEYNIGEPNGLWHWWWRKYQGIYKSWCFLLTPLRPHSVLGETLLCQNILISCHKSPDTRDFLRSHRYYYWYSSHISKLYKIRVRDNPGSEGGVRELWRGRNIKGSLNYIKYSRFTPWNQL